MAHHQKHGAQRDALVANPAQDRSTTSSMPAISEDEPAAEPDEPREPSSQEHQNFSKSIPTPSLSRRESLLTQALHTDSEYYPDADQTTLDTAKQAASISSTCSTFSARSLWDFTSDDGQVSAGTRASTPGSPRSIAGFEKHIAPFLPKPLARVSSHPVTLIKNEATTPEKPKEGNVEATLGRKRCITFACSNKSTPTPSKEALKPPPEPAVDQPPKRQSTIKFACPFKGSASPKAKTKFGRHLSPAPPVKKAAAATTNPSPKRSHRDSDTTIRNSSPMPLNESTPTLARLTRFKEKSPVRGEKMKCHIFASSDDEEDDWIQESTVHRSRLTVDDTLVKENKIRRLGEEAEEEEALEDEDEDDDDDDDLDLDATLEEDDDDGLVSDEGFHSDDEEGFAESDDDENNSDSDCEWWTPRKKTKSSSPFVHHRHFSGRPTPKRTGSGSSTDSLEEFSPKAYPTATATIARDAKKSPKRAKPVDIKPDVSDLPDSTDFVCGTLDEDKPLEEAYIANLKQFQASKHKTVPQDIDPTFPTSDPEMGMDEEDDDEEENAAVGFVDDGEHPNVFTVHGPAALDEEFRGRKPSIQRSSPVVSPKRVQSPAPLTKRPALPRSPAPPRVKLEPPVAKTTPTIHRTKSPHPNARSSPEAKVDEAKPLTLKRHSFLTLPSTRITHTSSLPRSPAPIGRKLLESAATTGQSTPALGASDIEDDDDFDPSNAYTRKAIDIKQGLEHKRLRRRQKLYSIYAHKAEKKKAKRPAPGKGADRMRQVGIDCAKYRGTRMLSL